MRFALQIAFADGRIAGIHGVADEATLASMHLERLGSTQ